MKTTTYPERASDMRWTAPMKLARRRTGIAAFERRCRCTREFGRRKKAYRVPGTPEHGRHRMLLEMTQREYGRILDARMAGENGGTD